MPWTSADLDGDGRDDVWQLQAPNGRVAQLRYDNNADGRPDEWVVFLEDRKVRTVATRFDGRVDERRIDYFAANGLLDHATVETLHRAGWRLDEDRKYHADRELLEITTWTDGVPSVRWESAWVN